MHCDEMECNEYLLKLKGTLLKYLLIELMKQIQEMLLAEGSLYKNRLMC